MHHMQVARSGSVKVIATNRKYVNVVGYAASSAAKAGDLLTVDADYGRLNVQRYRTVLNATASVVVSSKADAATVGDLTTLQTADKTSVVSALNELAGKTAPTDATDYLALYQAGKV